MILNIDWEEMETERERESWLGAGSTEIRHGTVACTHLGISGLTFQLLEIECDERSGAEQKWIGYNVGDRYGSPNMYTECLGSNI